MVEIVCSECGSAYYIESSHRSLRYCPFCGKKIKLPEEVKDAVKTLKEFCKARPCVSCAFYTPNSNCYFRSTAPLNWSVSVKED